MGCDIILLHRCKSSCNRDVCLSPMSDADRPHYVRQKEGYGHRACRRRMPSFVPPIANSFVFVRRRQAEECDHRGDNKPIGGQFLRPAKPNAECLCSGIFAVIARALQLGEAREN